MKFRKLPVVIEAIQFVGTFENINQLQAFLTPGKWSYNGIDAVIIIDTLEGLMTASVGDWIIKGVKGEFYPCKPDIFEATYEAVPDA